MPYVEKDQSGNIIAAYGSPQPDKVVVEVAEDNVGYLEFMNPSASTPIVVTMRQARLALLQTGMLASVNAAVAAADEATKITWEFSSEVQRDNPLVSTLAAALNMTDAQLDDIFTLAATL